MNQRSKIKILGKNYTIRTPESDIDPQELADFVDAKIQELAAGAPKASTLDMAVLAALNITLELFQARDRAREMEDTNKRLTEDWTTRTSGLVEQVKTALS